jgi:hypothetical protein
MKDYEKVSFTEAQVRVIESVSKHHHSKGVLLGLVISGGVALALSLGCLLAKSYGRYLFENLN